MKAGRTTLALGIAVTICFTLLTQTEAHAGTKNGRGLTGTGGELAPSTTSPLLGAYYSDWFPGNSTQGTLRQHLVPSQGADPTLVDSTAPSVAYRAIAQASKAGISFFALDYWPSRPAQNKNIQAFVRAKNLGDIRFCLLYETWDLGFDAAHEATMRSERCASRCRQSTPSSTASTTTTRDSCSRRAPPRNACRSGSAVGRTGRCAGPWSSVMVGFRSA